MSASVEVGSETAASPNDPSNRILKGPLARSVLRFGAPLAIGMGLQTTFNLVDAYILGRLEHGVADAALGAIGISDQVSALGTILSYGLSIATGTMLSRRAGERDTEGVKRVAFQSLLFILALSAVFGIVALGFSGVLMRDIVGAKGRVAVLGTSYLRTMLGGSFSIFLFLHLTSIQRALGSAKTPILMLLGANVLNFVLAVLLVYGPGAAPPVFAWGPPVAKLLGLPRLELLGAAWATILARVVFLVPTFFILMRRFDVFGRASWTRPNFAVIGKIWKLGWPTSVQLVVRISAMLVTHSVVARAFTTESDQSATTALGVVFRLETMALFVGLGWGSATQTFMGQNLGAGNRDRAKASVWYATLYNALMMVALTVVYRAFGPQIVDFFDSTRSVVAFASDYITWVTPSYAALGIGIVLGSAIQGAGATLETLAVDAAVVGLIQVPASIIVVFVAHQSATGLWLVVSTTYVIYAIAYVVLYRTGRFLKKAVAS